MGDPRQAAYDGDRRQQPYDLWWQTQFQLRGWGDAPAGSETNMSRVDSRADDTTVFNETKRTKECVEEDDGEADLFMFTPAFAARLFCDNEWRAPMNNGRNWAMPSNRRQEEQDMRAALLQSLGSGTDIDRGAIPYQPTQHATKPGARPAAAPALTLARTPSQILATDMDMDRSTARALIDHGIVPAPPEEPAQLVPEVNIGRTPSQTLAEEMGVDCSTAREMLTQGIMQVSEPKASSGPTSKAVVPPTGPSSLQDKAAVHRALDRIIEHTGQWIGPEKTVKHLIEASRGSWHFSDTEIKSFAAFVEHALVKVEPSAASLVANSAPFAARGCPTFSSVYYSTPTSLADANHRTWLQRSLQSCGAASRVVALVCCGKAASAISGLPELTYASDGALLESVACAALSLRVVWNESRKTIPATLGSLEKKTKKRKRSESTHLRANCSEPEEVTTTRIPILQAAMIAWSPVFPLALASNAVVLTGRDGCVHQQHLTGLLCIESMHVLMRRYRDYEY